ncbi:hypothetical protein GRX03_10645 [Halovenus sp. WSH3]|uniref:Type I restriction modification DNA specificity domain-containing protein n=1 Tax=Halovenus carboxidivorans TaxID=2692199 RepID=A0A6B0T264_9EURY|nr:restriction endonuclease subunit S [Halovenus carboxidivorans]MXR52055.1 hypothetical protein [Halovenus carboxidivorans]
MSKDSTLDDFIEDKKEKSSNLKLGPIEIDIPDEWDSKELTSVLDLTTGNNYSGKHLSDNDNGGRIFLTLKSVNKGGGFNWDSLKYYTGEVNDKEIVEPGDLLIANTDVTQDGDIVGYSIRVPDFNSKKEIAASMDLSILRPKCDSINIPYVEYLLQTNYVHSRMRAFSAGSTVLHLNTDLVKSLSLPFPPLPEQRKIATILHSVDQAIEKTEKIIEQAERTKQALMQSLFVDGYFEHGETVTAHHQNRLPRHPAEWQTKPAEDVMEVTRGAHPRPKSDDSLWRGETPIVKIGDRNRGDSRTITTTKEKVTEKGSQKSKLVDEGTLIVSNAGTVGVARITGMQTCIHDHWLILRDYEEDLSTRYLYYFINWNQEFLEALASGSTVLDLNTDDFRLFDVTFPPLDEQQKIADSLDSLHDQKMANIQYSEQLKRLKQGLMQDLLSGTVRTTDTNIQVPDEIEQYG